MSVHNEIHNQGTIETSRFLEHMEKSWQECAQQIQAEIEAHKTIEWGSFQENTFEGFGSQNTEKFIGSAKLNFLNSLLKHSLEWADQSSAFRRRFSQRFYRSPAGDQNREFSGYSGELNTREPKGLKPEYMSMRITRSCGKPLELPNVQKHTLEYRKRPDNLSDIAQK